MKKTPETQVRELCEEIRKKIERWKMLNEKGGSDPFWPDGVNMNLVRNQIIYAKRQMADICEEHGLKAPEEIYLPLPPKVNDFYMANLKDKKRVQRIGHPEKITTKQKKYDEQQLSLF